MSQKSSWQSDISIRGMSQTRRCEDAGQVLPLADGRLLVVLADGASGGGGHGDVAASLFLQHVIERVATGAAVEDLPGMFCHVDRQLAARNDTVGTTTGLVALVDGLGIHLVSCGDSEGWLFGFEDEWPEEMTAGQEKRRLGDDISRPMVHGPFPRRGPAVFATDGLVRVLWPEDVETVVRKAIRTGNAPATALVDAAQARVGVLTDDVSAIVLW